MTGERIRLGTYPVTMTAADWQHSLIALATAADEYRRLGLTETALAYERTVERLREQVMEAS